MSFVALLRLKVIRIPRRSPAPTEPWHRKRAPISSLVPAQRVVNSGGFTLDVFGANFTSGSKIVFNGTVYGATFVDATHLIANVNSSDIATLGSLNVKVSVPNPNVSGAFIDSAN